MTLNDTEWPFYVKFCFEQIRLEFLLGYFENNCVKTNKGRPMLPAAEMFNIDSSFWRCKVYVGIRGGSPSFKENFSQTCVSLSPHICRSGYSPKY